jgi:glycosyltransferase involved in cell wall biosynthesis
LKTSIIGPVYPLRGGIAQVTSMIYAELIKKGHDVQIINFKRQYPKFLFPGKTQEETSADALKVDSKIVIDTVNPWTWYKAYREVKKHRSDLLIFNFWMPFFAPCFGAISRLCRWFTKTKILFICHNIIPHEKRYGDMTLIRFALKPVDYFITMADVVTKDLLLLKPNARYEMTPLPVFNLFGNRMDRTEARRKLELNGNDNLILFFGFIRKYKGLDRLIKTLPLVLNRLQIKLLVVGEFYGDEEEYRELVRSHHLENQVIIKADYCPNEMVGLYFSAADVVVLPYRSATQSGIVQIAYHFNKPVIVTNVGGLQEIVHHEKTGLVVPPDDPEKLADAIVRYFNESLEKNMTGQIMVEKGKYTWEGFVSTIEKMTEIKPAI